MSVLSSAGGWIWDLLVMGTSFQHWPDGDPDALRELGDAWQALATELTASFQDMDADVAHVADAWRGPAGEAFAGRWQQLRHSETEGVTAFVTAAEQYAAACTDAALQLEFAQLLCEIIVAITAAEVAIGLAFAAFGGGEIAAGAVVAGRAAVGGVLPPLSEQMGAQILKQTVKEAGKLAADKAARVTAKDVARTAGRIGLTGLRAAGRGGATFGGADLLAQEIQIDEGHRDKLNRDLLIGDAVGGAAAGVVGLAAGHGLAAGFERAGVNRLTKAAGERLAKDRSDAGRRAAAVAGWGLRGAQQALVSGVANIPTMAALAITQKTLQTGDLVAALQYYGGKLSPSELAKEFAAGVLGGAIRHPIDSGAKALERHLDKRSETTAATASAMAHDTAAATLSALPADRRAEVNRTLADAAGEHTRAKEFRDLRVAALQRADAATNAPDRAHAREQAATYERLAAEADDRTVDHLTRATAAATDPAAFHDRTPVPAGADGVPAPVPHEDVGPAPVPNDGARHAPVRIPDQLADELHGLRVDHVVYATADTQAGLAHPTAPEVHQPRVETVPAGAPAAHAPQTSHRTPATPAEQAHAWRGLADGARSDLTASIDRVLTRPDLPGDVRAHVEGIRDAYRAEGQARVTADRHLRTAEQLLGEARAADAAGATGRAVADVHAAGEHAAGAEEHRLAARDALVDAERRFAALPETAPTHEAGEHPGGDEPPGPPHEPVAQEPVSPASDTTPEGVSPVAASATPHVPEPREPSFHEPARPTTEAGDAIRRLPTGELRLLAFGERLGSPAAPDLLQRLSSGLGELGDAVALRLPDTRSGELGPGVAVLGAEPIPGVTGRVSPLLRLDGLPGGADVIVGHHATAGVADALRDYAYRDTPVVQVVDRLPLLPDGTVDPRYVDVLRRSELVLTVGDTVTDSVQHLLDTSHDGRGGPPVRQLPPVFEARPESGRPPKDVFDILMHEPGADDADRAAEILGELRARGDNDARLTVTTHEPDGDARDRLSRRLTSIAGTRVTVEHLGDRSAETLATADVVLVPRLREAPDQRWLDPALVAAVEHGVPVLTTEGTTAARFAGDAVVPEGASPRTWADRVHEVYADREGARAEAHALRDELTRRYPREPAARALHEALSTIDGGHRRDPTARVDDVTWRTPLEPREVVMRHAEPAPEHPSGRPRVMTLCTEYWSDRGGIPTANRELTEGFAAAGADAVGLVSIVDPGRPGLTHAVADGGAEVRGGEPIWGVVDRKGELDTRAVLLLPRGIPEHVDVIVGHSRFSGGAAEWLQAHVYPDAQRVHVLHTSPEVLDGLKGDADGVAHAATERRLMAGADVVAGVGPLLGAEAARLAAEATPPGREGPKAHTIIPDMPAREGDPPPRPPDRRGSELLIQGRADDVIKDVRLAARLAADLASHDHPVRLVVRGAKPEHVAEQHRQLLDIVGGPRDGLEIEVRPFTKDQAELRADVDSADLVLMTSIHEGFGLVATEAVRAGKPVLVGEGTGAGMFLGDPARVPDEFGERLVVRDGNRLDVLRSELAKITKPDGRADKAGLDALRDRIEAARRPAWVERITEMLAHPDRDADLRLRDWLAATYPPGSAAHGMLDALGRPVAEPRGVHGADGDPGRGDGRREGTLDSIRAALMPDEASPPPDASASDPAHTGAGDDAASHGGNGGDPPPPEHHRPADRPEPVEPLLHVDPPLTAKGAIDFAAWETRLRQQGVTADPRDNGGDELTARIYKARRNDPHSVSELLTADRYSAAGIQVRFRRTLDNVADPTTGEHFKNPDMEVTRPGSDVPHLLENKYREGGHPMTRRRLMTLIQNATEQLDGAWVRSEGDHGEIVLQSGRAANSRGEVVIDATESAPVMTSTEVHEALLERANKPSETRRYEAIVRLEVRYRDASDGLMKVSVMTREPEQGPRVRIFTVKDKGQEP